MRKAILGAALLAAAVAGGNATLAQNAAVPATPAPAAASSPPGPIAALQQQLKEQGFAPGPVNGVMTERTRQALAAYERRMRRPPAALVAAGPGGGAAGDPVLRAQKALQQMSLLRGPADGVVGPATRDAIINFQASRHLAVDPRVTDALLAALDEAAATAAAPAAPLTGTAAEQAARPAAEGAQAPPAGAAAEAPADETGRRPLPAGVNPPPIR